MERDKSYYEIQLVHIENIQLHAVGELLDIEILVYEARKLLQLALELNELNNPALSKAKALIIELRGKHRILANEIEEHDLDIKHCRFMIDLLNRPDTDDG